MAEEVTRNIHFKNQKSAKRTSAHMRVRVYTPQEQKMRALKSLLTFWAIAAVCVLIPIAHFILVPGFFIGGIIVALRTRKQSEEGLAANGACPGCRKDIELRLEKQAELPQWHTCPECGESLELQAVESDVH